MVNSINGPKASVQTIKTDGSADNMELKEFLEIEREVHYEVNKTSESNKGNSVSAVIKEKESLAAVTKPVSIQKSP